MTTIQSISTIPFPGAIVYVDRFPYEEDRHLGKPRFAFVTEVRGGQIVSHGIYTEFRHGRVPIRATRANGLHHDSYIDSRVVQLSRRDASCVGETPTEFDPFNEFAA